MAVTGLFLALIALAGLWAAAFYVGIGYKPERGRMGYRARIRKARFWVLLGNGMPVAVYRQRTLAGQKMRTLAAPNQPAPMMLQTPKQEDVSRRLASTHESERMELAGRAVAAVSTVVLIISWALSPLMILIAIVGYPIAQFATKSFYSQSQQPVPRGPQTQQLQQQQQPKEEDEPW